MKNSVQWHVLAFLPALLMAASGMTAVTVGHAAGAPQETQSCIDCHRTHSPALVREWERSRHAEQGISCLECHGSSAGAPGAEAESAETPGTGKEAAETSRADEAGASADGSWTHHGALVSALVTPRRCGECHGDEFEQFSRSHHARAGEILASLDNVLAEKAAGTPDNIADAVSGCWQCHGGIVTFMRGPDGTVLREGPEGKPVLDPATWPNSGMGRLNPDGTKGSCNACHPRHAFEAKLARSPENCGKCHMGPDHPQIEIYNESKHGIAFHANRDQMALDAEGEWVLGRDYSAAPTCASCHISSYMTPQGALAANTHDVGERISWTLRPVVSTKLNLVTFEDGTKEDYPDTRKLPKIGESVETIDKVVENEKLISKAVPRTVAGITTWHERRDKMKGACLNCHGDSHVDNFYEQFDDLVALFNEKFARPAQELMNELIQDGVLKKEAPFEHDVQWVFYELWHHEGRRARHGASMMGPDFTHWHGMYEVSKHYYTEFLPAVVEAATGKSPELGVKYEKKVGELLTRPEHRWLKGLTPQEAEALRKAYEQRYNQ